MMAGSPCILPDYHCNKLNDGVNMSFVDTVIINVYAFVKGHPTHSDDFNHIGMSIYD